MLIELVDLSDWKKKQEIIKELKQQDLIIDERKFRAIVKHHNKSFYNHDTDIFIAHSCKGYKATKSEEEIRDSIADNRKRALNMLYEESQVKRALGENINFNLKITNDGMYYTDF